MGIATTLASDAGFQVVAAYAPDLEGPIAIGWIMSNVVWGAAALHRSAGAGDPPAPVVEQRPGRGRLALPAACTLLVPRCCSPRD
ncbi:hypothetical protein AB0368_00785 [Actinoplanes sp. NPDC051475]|uniref:hypothetical protein n=1 Tax=Actinoplanes sp. NPDC051475 TaxID=3157225 RepID=UPI00344C32CB